MRLPWKENKTVVFHTLWDTKSPKPGFQDRTLAQQPQYFAAKKMGNYDAAFEIVDRLITPAAMSMIEARLDPASYMTDPWTKHPIVVAPVKLGGSNNVLPIACAHRIAYEFGLDVCRDIVQTDVSSRSGKSGLYRLLHQAEFSGPVQKGRQYVIVDDVYTLGGSIAGLASYIEANGGHVACSTVLAASGTLEKGTLAERFRSKEVPFSIGQEQLDQIDKNYGWGFARKFENAVGFAVEALTSREGNFVARFSKCQREFFRAVDAERAGETDPNANAYSFSIRQRHAGHTGSARTGGGLPQAQPASIIQ